MKSLSIIAAVCISLSFTQVQAQTGTSTAKKGKKTGATSTTTAKKDKNSSKKSKGTGAMTISSEKDKISYTIGGNLGKNFKDQNFDFNPEMIARGISDAMSGTMTLMTEEEMKATFAEFQKVMAVKQQEKMKMQQEQSGKLAEGAKKRGADFMAGNASQQGVVTLPSGVQYKIVTEGSGSKPSASSTVTTHYRGALLSGKVFDSSYDRGQPASFPVNGVIAGWTEVLQLMSVGSKWTVWIPSDKAYGDQGAGQDIGPGETLAFDIELISIQ